MRGVIDFSVSLFVAALAAEVAKSKYLLVKFAAIECTRTLTILAKYKD